MKKKTVKQKAKPTVEAVSAVKTLYVRNLREDNYEWIKKQAVKRGYCPSTLLNRLVDHARTETKLEML